MNRVALCPIPLGDDRERVGSGNRNKYRPRAKACAKSLAPDTAYDPIGKPASIHVAQTNAACARSSIAR